MKLIHKEDVIALRRKAYPSTGDQLDAIWKALIESGLADSNTEVKAMKEQLIAIKDKLPKL